MSEKEQNFTAKKSTRRNFLKNSGLTLGGLVLGGAVTSLVVKDTEETVTTSGPAHSANQNETVNHNKALMFFTPEQYSTISAATEQIFPETEVGPGAEALLVPYFIDHQLAGAYGLMSKEYTKGPFYPKEATPLFGHQTHLTRQDIFVLGINLLNSEATKRYEKKFYELEAEQQIEILTAVEADEVELNAATTPSYFFKLLRAATLEGVYSDPLYGGNKDMGGWKMKKFPGHQMSYANMVEKEEFVEIEPQSLTAQHNH
ncbi:gluconate 2-dehydrogenase subunit 3 family protein [Ureibacillus aquaedulcis]|uniref:Gluconate 2-dehydrogenase subunit 3 family protein n=1 Tax=Ureibacillus aquaedulcis TaxID=3058421 RepID=A0ABT8GPS3_9BACL|nr:gluconate 2-dehydrogenase subunit 3 family protein [Ureibacillus sp. BA0131]MDN4493397.1 gluconate 2-dehydrogenase subunit 3 family protein [Ureibacillus sp. BA0131]